MPLALIALAISAFGIGTTEFVIMGLLPEVATDLSVSIPTAGLLISGYALGVVVGAPLLTALGSRLPRKTMLVALVALFIAGNLLSALAPGYGLLMAGRIVAALSHGAFFGVGSVVATSLVAADKQARAIALMFTGLTVANVLGVPMGTALGQHLGWRSTFWAVTALGVVSLVGILTLVPAQPLDRSGGLRRELAVFRRPQVWLALAMTTLGFGGVFASFSYVAPMMTEVAGFSSGAVTWLLVLFGVGLFAGNLLGGRLADRRLMPSLAVILAVLTGVLVVFVFTAHSAVLAAITLLVFGAAGFATVPPLQTRVMEQAAGAPALASAANIAAFNLGNAGGSFLGGLAIDAGLGYTAPNWVGAALAAAGLAVTVLSGLLDRRRRVGRRPVAAHPVTTSAAA
ncbi:MFS transporter [Goodfellowiella coeruleoviolacea]|uniref:MFS transporter, DHA1 family, arabinose polymer transporter n=1 Tax=Goodfellowiella coeruleoviolacea TaxID=334858 RepID=A0AAE3GF56_9PSEU|nr:MFS transporter [Goodfellowiella coeruleoviolacea]MCP2166200.1 MFS transporter, DHA1 family, arabinose polymer transporter [Goodfellowiella coeruleoviolacea]